METITLADLGQNAPGADINGNHDDQEEVYTCGADFFTAVTSSIEKISVGTITGIY